MNEPNRQYPTVDPDKQFSAERQPGHTAVQEPGMAAPLQPSPAGDAGAAVLRGAEDVGTATEPWPWGDLVARVGQLQVFSDEPSEGHDEAALPAPRKVGAYGEPWRHRGLEVLDGDGVLVCDSINTPLTIEADDAKLRRIVACVNFCEVLSAEYLEELAALFAAMEVAMEVERDAETDGEGA